MFASIRPRERSRGRAGSWTGEKSPGEIGRFESFPTRVRKYVVSLLGATESSKSARRAALNEHTSFRVIHASAGCPRASIRDARGCVCVSDGNDDLASGGGGGNDVRGFPGKSPRSCRSRGPPPPAPSPGGFRCVTDTRARSERR